MASFPVIKLVGLTIKTLAKPISKRIKHELTRYKTGTILLSNLGEGIHQITSRFTIWSSGYSVRYVKPLETEKALKNGSEVVGESFLLLVSGTLVIYENRKSKERERQKEQKTKSEREEFRNELHKLNIRIDELENKIIQQEEEKQKEKQKQIAEQTKRKTTIATKSMGLKYFFFRE